MVEAEVGVSEEAEEAHMVVEAGVVEAGEAEVARPVPELIVHSSP
jgi:hypothetical protein